MKTLLSTLVISTLLTLPAYANIENRAEHIQTMRQAATELQATNPALSKKLNDFADKKEKWSGEKGEDFQKMIAEKRQDLQRVRQAGSELKGKNDSLATDLTDMADRWEKKLAEKEKKAAEKKG